jgi:hypothetical protein
MQEALRINFLLLEMCYASQEEFDKQYIISYAFARRNSQRFKNLGIDVVLAAWNRCIPLWLDSKTRRERA